MEIRTPTIEEARQIAQVHVATWQTTYRGLMPDEYLDRLSVARREKMWQGAIERPAEHDHLFVAEEEGAIIGFTCGGKAREEIESYDGEIYAIYLLEDFQGQGYGKKLFTKSIEQLKADGFGSMYLWAMQGNPTEGFYRHMGGRQVAKKEDRIDQLTITEVCYGFDAI